MSPEKKTKYNELYRTFNPAGFDAQEWMDFFKRCGMQAFAFTSKHCDGFSMFHTETRIRQRVNYLNPPEQIIEPCDLKYSIEETPFKRDIVGELCDAAHRNGIKVNLYYSHPDWYDADFRPYCSHPLTTPNMKLYPKDYGSWIATPVVETPERTPEETARMVARHREQLRELLTNYGKIDMICLDMWLGKDVWHEIKNTVKMMRQLQPDVMIRARGIGNYGDYYQPEEFVPNGVENTNMPWMSICLLGNIFAYDSVAEHYKGTRWVVRHLVDCVAKGGSFMVCIGPDANGKFHPEAVRQLEETGRWLAVNGEGIYDTRSREIWQSDSIRFTQSKDGKRVYAFTENLPDGQLTVKSVEPAPDSEIHLLGYKKNLKWTYGNGTLTIHLPSALQKEANRPCKYIYAFRITPKGIMNYEL
jgi:alpha-L-fucosidase